VSVDLRALAAEAGITTDRLRALRRALREMVASQGDSHFPDPRKVPRPSPPDHPRRWLTGASDVRPLPPVTPSLGPLPPPEPYDPPAFFGREREVEPVDNSLKREIILSLGQGPQQARYLDRLIRGGRTRTAVRTALRALLREGEVRKLGGLSPAYALTR
jgi:hypothetical protein